MQQHAPTLQSARRFRVQVSLSTQPELGLRGLNQPTIVGREDHTACAQASVKTNLQASVQVRNRLCKCRIYSDKTTNCQSSIHNKQYKNNYIQSPLMQTWVSIDTINEGIHRFHILRPGTKENNQQLIL